MLWIPSCCRRPSAQDKGAWRTTGLRPPWLGIVLKKRIYEHRKLSLGDVLRNSF